MCGIAGIFSLDGWPVSADALRAMNASLAHRGPDDAGLYVQGRAGLAMRRLAIIGVDNGRQPICSEDGDVVLVMNGELYNYRALKTELQRRGHRFATETDVEVAVHLYEDEGVEFVKRLRGMFAFALYDRRCDRLVLGRDPAGKKPLYWARHAGRLLFASEIKALHASGHLPKELDTGALRSYLMHGFVAGDRTLFAGVRKVPPGSLLVGRGEALEVVEFWNLRDLRPFAGTFEAAAVRLRELLDDAVGIRLMSEVPLGAFLSGGLDSSAVVALMSRHLERPVETFSVGFDDGALDELVHAREAARHLGTRHHEVVVRACPPALLWETNWQNDEPAADPAAVPTLCLARFARQHVTVVLTGEGGDEAFGGYRHYVLGRRVDEMTQTVPGLRTLARRLLALERSVGTRLPKRWWKGIWLASLAAADRVPGWLSAFTDRELRALLVTAGDAAPPLDTGVPVWPGNGADALAWALMYADARMSLPSGLLMKVDKMTMAASLEARCPLLDREVVEFAWSLPLGMKMAAGETKRVFRRAIRDLIAPTLLARPKHGFDVPLRRWLLRDLEPLALPLLLADDSPLAPYVRLSGIRGLWAVLERRDDELVARQLWRLLNLAVWHEQHWPGAWSRTAGRALADRRGGEPAVAGVG